MSFLNWAWFCAACRRRPPDHATFPLCLLCRESLLRCPPLCAKCASLSCPVSKTELTCQRPWFPEGALDSHHARYLLTGMGYTVLKRWKVSGSSGFDRRILIADPELERRLHELDCQAVVAVPQRYRRSWQLGGSPAWRVARWMAQKLSLPLIDPWCVRDIAPGAVTALRQAELAREERIRTRFGFKLHGEARLEPRILLVDDFFTTGHTMRGAAETLRSGGALRVHAFSLGFRPELLRIDALDAQHRRDLLERGSRAEGVRQEADAAFGPEQGRFDRS